MENVLAGGPSLGSCLMILSEGPPSGKKKRKKLFSHSFSSKLEEHAQQTYKSKEPTCHLPILMRWGHSGSQSHCSLWFLLCSLDNLITQGIENCKARQIF